MLELILVRHGETDSNVKGTYCGWTNIELNNKGLQQASQAAGKLKTIKFDGVYSSTLKRAWQTANIICEDSGLPVICKESLREQNFGEWEDLTYSEINERYPEECIQWQDDWVNYCVKGGESPHQVYERVSGFIDELVSKYESGIVLIATHLGCIRFILSYLLGMGIEGFWRFRVDNGSISRIKLTEEKYGYLTALNL